MAEENLNEIAEGEAPPGVAGNMAHRLETEMINQAKSLENRM
jgi:hypothetical protein